MSDWSPFALVSWEGDEYVICFRGKPIGQTVGKNDGMMILRWLETARYSFPISDSSGGVVVSEGGEG